MSLLTTKRKPKRDPATLYLALGLMLGGVVVAIIFWVAL